MAEKLEITASFAGGKQVETGISAIGDAAQKSATQLDKLHDAMGTAGAKGLAGATSQAGANVGGMARQFTLMERAGSTGLRNLVGGFGLVATSAAAAGLAIGGIVQAGRSAVELGKLGGESLTVKASFEQMMRSVNVATSELGQMQAAAGGTISTLKLLELANYSVIGVTGQVGQAIGQANDQLIAIARAAFKARPSLQSVEFAYQSLVDGVKRVEKRLVDNLGLQVKAREANEKYAAAVGKSVDELTAEEVQLAFLNEVLRAGGILIQQVGGSVDTMNDAFSRATAAATNLKVAIGEKLAPAITDATNAWAAFLETLSQPLLSPQDQAQYQMRILRQEIEALSVAYKKTQSDAERDPFGLGAANAEQLAIQLQQAKDELYALEIATNAANFATQNAARVAREYAEDLSLVEAAARATRQALDDYAESVKLRWKEENRINEAVEKASEGALGSAVQSLSELGASYTDAAKAGKEYADAVADLTRKWESGQISIEEYKYGLGQAALKLRDVRDEYKQTTPKVNEFTDALRGLVESNLSASFKAGELAPGLSVREDEVDEHYRRLAAIAVRGQEELDKHQTDWADTLALIPEDVRAQGVAAMQAWAKDKVLAYDKGLDFSLINRDTIKKRIMEALLAQEMKKQLVDEITAELGGAVSQAQVSAAASMALGGTPLGQISLGGITFGAAETPPDMSAVATQIGTQLNFAFKEKFNGEEIIRMTSTAVLAGSRSTEAVLKIAGDAVGQKIMGGVYGAVRSGAPDVVNALAVAIAPSVARIIQSQRSSSSSGGVN